MTDVRLRGVKFTVGMAETTTYDDMSKNRRTFIPGLVRAQGEVFTGTYDLDGRQVDHWVAVEGYGTNKAAARAQLVEHSRLIAKILAEPDGS